MASKYYIARDGKTTGPYTSAELREMAKNGQLSATDLLWREGKKKWKPAGEVGNLFEGASVPVAPPPPPALFSSPAPVAPAEVTPSPVIDPAPTAPTGAATLGAPVVPTTPPETTSRSTDPIAAATEQMGTRIREILGWDDASPAGKKRRTIIIAGGAIGLLFVCMFMLSLIGVLLSPSLTANRPSPTIRDAPAEQSKETPMNRTQFQILNPTLKGGRTNTFAFLGKYNAGQYDLVKTSKQVRVWRKRGISIAIIGPEENITGILLSFDRAGGQRDALESAALQAYTISGAYSPDRFEEQKILEMSQTLGSTLKSLNQRGSSEWAWRPIGEISVGLTFRRGFSYLYIRHKLSTHEIDIQGIMGP
jgi:GYF domain 2